METLILNAPPRPLTAVPAGYVLHYYTTKCLACGTGGNGSDFYSLTLIRNRTHTGTARQLTRCAIPLYNVPVERIHVGTRITPFCAECPTIDVTHLPPPPTAAALHDLAGPAMRDTRPTASTAAGRPPAKPAAPAPRATKPRIEDLA